MPFRLVLEDGPFQLLAFALTDFVQNGTKKRLVYIFRFVFSELPRQLRPNSGIIETNHVTILHDLTVSIMVFSIALVNNLLFAFQSLIDVP